MASERETFIKRHAPVSVSKQQNAISPLFPFVEEGGKNPLLVVDTYRIDD